MLAWWSLPLRNKTLLSTLRSVWEGKNDTGFFFRRTFAGADVCVYGLPLSSLALRRTLIVLHIRPVSRDRLSMTQSMYSAV